jgi:hypothetical protein
MTAARINLAGGSVIEECPVRGSLNPEVQTKAQWVAESGSARNPSPIHMDLKETFACLKALESTPDHP